MAPPSKATDLHEADSLILGNKLQKYQQQVQARKTAEIPKRKNKCRDEGKKDLPNRTGFLGLSKTQGQHKEPEEVADKSVKVFSQGRSHAQCGSGVLETQGLRGKKRNAKDLKYTR